MGSDEKPEPLIESEDAEPAKPVSDEMDVKRSANTKQRREKSQRRGFEKERVAAEGLQPRHFRAPPEVLALGKLLSPSISGPSDTIFPLFVGPRV